MKNNRLSIFTHIIARLCETHTELLNAVCGQNAGVYCGTYGGAQCTNCGSES